MIRQRSFARTPDSIPEARRFVLGQLAGLSQATLDQISLIVSELATNAVQHAATSFTVALKVAGQSLTLEVTDHSSLQARPADHPPPPTQTHGRGLLIVSRLATEWGITPSRARSGKTVWVKLRLDDAERGHGPQRAGQTAEN